MQLDLSIPYPPASGNHQYGKGRHGGMFLKPKVKTYRLAVKALVLELPGDMRAMLPLTGDMEVHVDLLPPDKRVRDSGNAIKVIYDALTRAGVWKDDSQAKLEHLASLGPLKGGLVRISIKPIEF